MSETQELTQLPIAETRKSCNGLAKNGLIELSGKEYILTPKVYEAIKFDVEYTQDKTIQFIEAKSRILDYLEQEKSITNEKIRELCGFTKQQARAVTDKMRVENILKMKGRGRLSRYVKADN